MAGRDVTENLLDVASGLRGRELRFLDASTFDTATVFVTAVLRLHRTKPHMARKFQMPPVDLDRMALRILFNALDPLANKNNPAYWLAIFRRK